MGTLRSVEISVACTLRIPRPCGAPRTVDNVFAPGGAEFSNAEEHLGPGHLDPTGEGS